MRKFLVTVNGSSYEVVVEEIEGLTRLQPVTQAPEAAPIRQAAAPAPASPKAGVPAGGEKVVSPMPGNIVAIHAEVGQTVKTGDVLLVLEAMKMENEIPSPVSGNISHIAVKKGTNVNTGDLLIIIE